MNDNRPWYCLILLRVLMCYILAWGVDTAGAGLVLLLIYKYRVGECDCLIECNQQLASLNINECNFHNQWTMLQRLPGGKWRTARLLIPASSFLHRHMATMQSNRPVHSSSEQFQCLLLCLFHPRKKKLKKKKIKKKKFIKIEKI